MMRALSHAFELTPDANEKAIIDLEQALLQDPDYGSALALLAWCYSARVSYMWCTTPSEDRERSLELAQQAVRVSADDAFALEMLSAAHAMVGNIDQAEIAASRALEIDPNSAFAWMRSGWVCVYRGNGPLAREHFQRAIRLSPMDPSNFNCFAGMGASYYTEDPAQSIVWLKKALAANPSAVWVYRGLTACHALLGRTQDAKLFAGRLMQYFPGVTISKVVSSLPLTAAALEQMSKGLRLAGIPE